MEAAESVLLPPSECNVTWQFALCLILPTLKQENPAPMETGNDRPCNRNIRKNLSEWNSCCIFTTLDLPKPLNNAQIWGAFYFYTLWAFNLTRSIHTPLNLPPCWKTEVGTLGTPNGRSIISETLAITGLAPICIPCCRYPRSFIDTRQTAPFKTHLTHIVSIRNCDCFSLTI